MKIETTNKNGERVVIEYSKKIIDPKPIKPEIIINDYPTYRNCVIESSNQKEYTRDCRDTRYEKALQELISRDHNLYMSFCKKLQEEFRSSR